MQKQTQRTWFEGKYLFSDYITHFILFFIRCLIDALVGLIEDRPSEERGREEVRKDAMMKRIERQVLGSSRCSRNQKTYMAARQPVEYHEGFGPFLASGLRGKN